MTAWQKFLNQTIPDPKLQAEFQEFIGIAIKQSLKEAISAKKSEGNRR
jgi:hypothetical protein